MAVDALSDYGATPVTFLPETLEKLDAILPSHWSHANPVDILGDATENLFSQAIQICMDAEEVNGILVILPPGTINDPTLAAQALIKQLQGKKFPVFAVWLGSASVEEGQRLFKPCGYSNL